MKKCFYCGSVVDGYDKCPHCGGRLEEIGDTNMLSGHRNSGLTWSQILHRASEKHEDVAPVVCCSDCGRRLVETSRKLVRYLNQDYYFFTGFGKDRRKHSFEAGSPKYRVIYRCPNRGWWRCRDEARYFLWPDGTLTSAWYWD